jgi:hypothetical protein
MAVKLISHKQIAYQAWSTDTWPTAPAEGSTLYVVDTGQSWVYFDGVWYPNLADRARELAGV